MPSSDISICNIALGLLGQRPIRSFDEDNSRARLCKAEYDMSVGLVLSRMDWPFARKSSLLVIDPDVDTEDGYVAYVIPPDCIVPRFLRPMGAVKGWQVEGGHIITTEVEGLRLVYTCRNLNPSMYSEGFKHSVARLMAATLAGPLTEASVSSISRLMDLFETQLEMSSIVDVNVGKDFPDYEEDPNNDSFNMV